MANPLVDIQQYGQSVWYDNIQRSLITSGELQRLVENDALMGVTSNPAIFEKAITGSQDYDAALQALERPQDMDAKAIYEYLAVGDIQMATDVLAPVYTRTNKRDGYVSLEVSPYLAHDTAGTVEEARRLWHTVARNNVMIKVPATPAGIPAIQQLISEGINVNITLLFHLAMYEQVAAAYINGLEALVARGGDPSGVASVASFFISRIDSAVDAQIEARLHTAQGDEATALRSLLGQVAIANAKLTYQRYQAIYDSARWQTLAARGAQTQRLLWASTSTKNPAYRDVLYIEELMGRDTVNTVPTATFDAFREHGQPRASLEEQVDEARHTIETLERLGISLRAIADTLLDDAVKLFADPFDKLLSAVERKRQALLGSAFPRMTQALSEALAANVQASLEDWRITGKIRRLWARDASVWTNTDEASWLGWLDIVDDQLAHVEHLRAVAQDVREAGFTHVLLLGMGGSSLAPEVLHMTFGSATGFPTLHVLDSTDPAQVQRFEQKVDLAKTLCIVSSKSGTTLEPNIFQQYFYARLEQTVGAAEAGRHFIAITDPGSKLQQVAESLSFRHIFYGWPNIGGRYSALSDFGMVPAALLGLDVRRLLEHTVAMVRSCAASVPPADNPGVVLGTIIGTLAKQGRDKVTIVTSPGLWDFGAWLEQLLAESTGKEGKGLIPVDLEPLGTPAVYGADRLFVSTRLAGETDAAQEAALAALEAAGHPVVRITLPDAYHLGAEMFRWEMATAVAGAIIGINPFDQPDVEASKDATRKLTAAYEQTGALPPETPVLEVDGLKLFTDGTNAAALAQAAGGRHTLVAYLKAHFDRLGAGDYCCLSAYIDMQETHQKSLAAIRHAIRDRKHVATCLGFGPRFLHSTGQAYKGGPNSGIFVQITCDDAQDVPVPERQYTFGVVKAAQARGDFAVLVERQRRALRVHLGRDVAAGLATLQQAVKQALA